MNKKYRIRVIVAIIVGVLAVLAFLGIAYPVRIFDIQLGALVQRVFIDFSIVALALLLFALVMTFLFGRLYCSTLCPFGLLQEVACTFKKKNAGKQKNLPVKYVVAAASFGMLAGGTAYYYRLVEPYTYFGALFTLGGLVAVLAAVVVIITVFKDRVFCTNFCPVGAVLGVISKFSPNKIYIEKDACVLCSKCEKICQAGAIDFKAKAIDNEMCVKCLKCLNGVCPTKAIKYGCNCKKEKNAAAFNPKRRDIMLAVGAIALFGGAARAGRLVKNSVSERLSDVILPPGAMSEARLLNTCLNCNICVKVCPSRIIKKATREFRAVHIDFSKDYCRFNCHRCANACPAGAIKRMPLAQKQILRIAMIMPPTELFDGFEKCVEACPWDALQIRDGRPVFLPTLCIGCGACVIASGGRIKIFGASEQRLVGVWG